MDFRQIVSGIAADRDRAIDDDVLRAAHNVDYGGRVHVVRGTNGTRRRVLAHTGRRRDPLIPVGPSRDLAGPVRKGDDQEEETAS